MIWNPGWETGHALIDQQHKALLAQFEALLVAIHENHPEDRIPGLLNYLADYVEIHFSMEEAKMQETGYPLFKGHKAIHDDMRTRVAQLLDGFRNDPSTMTDEVIDFLTDWLLRHINEEDRRMARHLHQSGHQESRAQH